MSIGRLAIIVTLVLSLAGCALEMGPMGPRVVPADGGGSLVGSESQEVDTPEAVGSGDHPQDPEIARLLPSNGMQLRLNSASDHVVETYLRDGERLVVAADGRVSATWFVTPEGIWWRDPLGTDLLRFLPPEAVEDTAWVQGSGPDAVWFLLQRRPACVGIHGRPMPECWDLTVLNRLTRSVYRFAEGNALLLRETEDLRDAASLHQEELRQVQVGSVDREALLSQADVRPDGPLPVVTEVSPADFHTALVEALRLAGRPFTEVDLDGDGAPERIEGPLNEWSSHPLHLFHSDGRRLPHSFINYFENGWQHHLEVATLSDVDRPTLLYQYGEPDAWHRIVPTWFHGHLVQAWGWHPKITEVIGSQVSITADGALEVTGAGAEMGGFLWTRRFRVETEPDDVPTYRARLASEDLTPGPQPEDHRSLLMAAFVSHWFSLPEEMERFIPDPTVRASFAQESIRKPLYRPMQPDLGKVIYQTNVEGPAVPEVEPGAIGADGATEFLIRVGEYEGYTYYAGTVRFGAAPDGRPVILDLHVTETGFIY